MKLMKLKSKKEISICGIYELNYEEGKHIVTTGWGRLLPR